MIQKSLKYILINSLSVSFFFIIFHFGLVSANSLNVTLVSPKNNEIFNTTNNVTFVCNVTSDQYIESINLYHNINGSFVLNQTKDVGQIEPDSSSVLLFHFNNDSSVGENESFVYDWTGNGNNGKVYGATFNLTSGKFYGAFEFNGSNNYIEMYDSDSLDLVSEGTIEFWLKYNKVNTWTAVITKDESCGNTFPYAIYLSPNPVQLRFVLDDWNVDFKSNTFLNSSTWYHIVTTWNSTETRIYINGTLDNTNNDPKTMYADESKLRIGITKPDCGWGEGSGSFNGSVDELVLYNRMLKSEEVNEHFNRNFINETEANWTLNNVPDGTYLWNCLVYDNESQSNWSYNNYTFSLDMQTPPTVNSIILYPNSTDDIDPGVTINVTANVTDISNVSTVIFQWKELIDWNNITMDYNELTHLYENASIPLDEGVYYYRIWSNDINGNSGYSDIKNISAEWDYTWDRSPSNFTISGIKDTYGSTFLTINNTGDKTLIFSLSHDWMSDIYFNNSLNTLLFSLNKSKESVINVTVHFLVYTSELDTHITINASHPLANPSPKYLTVNATINSYVGGPYLDLSIVDYPSTIYQSESTNLTAKIKNIGNETATGVWLNWTLPIGWSNTSGNLNQYLENITSGSTKWGSVLVTLDPSTARAEIVTLYVNASCNENVSSPPNSKIVGVNCNNSDGICGAGCTYVSDSNCPTPSLGGETTTEPTIPYAVAKEETFLLYTEESLELVRGLNNTFVLKVTNPSENEDFMNVSLDASSYLSQYIRIEPTFVNRINKNQTKDFMIFIEAPKYFTEGKYVLNFTITGISKGKRITENRLVTLYVHEVSREEAIGYLNQSQNILNEMKDAGLNVKKILELVTKANQYFEEKNYEEVKKTYEDIKEISNYAFQVQSLIEEVEKEIVDNEDKGLKVPSAKNLFSLSKVAFMRGDFVTALKRIEDCQNILSLETKGKINYMKLALDYWWVIVLGITVSYITGYFIHLRLEIYRTTDRLRNLRYEELSIMDKMRDTREKTFKENLMSMTDYHKAMYEYQKRLTEIRKEVTRLRTKRAGMKNIQTEIKNLEEEKKSIEKLIEETQISYFQNGEINRSIYDNKMNALTESLAELEKNIEILKIKHEHKG